MDNKQIRKLRSINDFPALVEYLRYSRYLGKNRLERSYAAVVLRQGREPAFAVCGEAKEIERELAREDGE